jgi:membrane-associated phospholipid phosphatase
MTQPPLQPALRPTSWRHWLTLWLLVAASLTALLANNAKLDTYTWCATRWFVGDREYYNWQKYHAAQATQPDRSSAPFYETKSPPFKYAFYKRTESLWETLKAFGEPWTTAIILVLIALYDRRTWLASAAALAATALAGGLGFLIRITDGRFRPTHTDALNHWQFLRGFHDGKDLSFPSGHATLAFATAAVLSYLSPKGRAVFLTVAAGTAASRVVMGAHYWSDALFGAALGWTVSWFTFHLVARVSRPVLPHPETPQSAP